MQINIGILEDDRERSAQSVAKLLADTYTLYLKKPTATVGTWKARYFNS